MPPPPRRARFQIHLSTAIVLMFVAGGLMWANVNERRVMGYLTGIAWGPPTRTYEVTESEFFASENYIQWYGDRYVEYGWPVCLMQSRTRVLINRDGQMQQQPKQRTDEWFTESMIYNALIALAILFAVWFLCEWLIRRRAGRMRG